MKRIKNLILIIAGAVSLANCSTLQFISITETEKPGKYYATVRTPQATYTANGRTTTTYRYGIMKCEATSELNWSCAEVAVNTRN